MLATAVQNSKKAESVTRRKDIQEFLELLQPVEEVVSGDEAEEEEIIADQGLIPIRARFQNSSPQLNHSPKRL
jgi:hypothetical protein